METTELEIANGRIRVLGTRLKGATLDAFGPFLCSGSSDASLFIQDLEITENETTFHRWKRAGCDFAYRRHDLEFMVDAGRCYGWHTGESSGVLALVELALWWAVERAGGFMLHASAGVRDGQAWIMPGPSGTGKSTAARGGFERVLSDERVIIMPGETSNTYVAWGTPFWSDGRDRPMDKGSAPVHFVAKLHHGDMSALCPLSVGELTPWVLRSTISYSHEAAHLTRNFEAVCAFTEAVAGMRLTYPKEGLWVSSTPLPTGLAS
ncbi:MAG: hypothetical protein VX589_15165 [Myxococcota bacterium]|nr:hypothetical protein [Myxococcota bacterium]